MSSLLRVVSALRAGSVARAPLRRVRAMSVAATPVMRQTATLGSPAAEPPPRPRPTIPTSHIFAAVTIYAGQMWVLRGTPEYNLIAVSELSVGSFVWAGRRGAFCR